MVLNAFLFALLSPVQSSFPLRASVGPDRLAHSFRVFRVFRGSILSAFSAPRPAVHGGFTKSIPCRSRREEAHFRRTREIRASSRRLLRRLNRPWEIVEVVSDRPNTEWSAALAAGRRRGPRVQVGPPRPRPPRPGRDTARDGRRESRCPAMNCRPAPAPGAE